MFHIFPLWVGDSRIYPLLCSACRKRGRRGSSFILKGVVQVRAYCIKPFCQNLTKPRASSVMDEICIISSRHLCNISWVALSAYKRQLGDPIGCCQRLARNDKDKCLV